ncbi:MAG: hypothetical protein KatS3mg015_1892 [Fimbriimonadales bacterium]|nr:MAG: hypothetical protein KatS3mg015_1892 [Fimbriimonadales bacterium]
MIYPRRVPRPNDLRPLTYREKQRIFGPVRVLENLPDGRVRLDPAWKRKHLTTVVLPGLEQIRGGAKSGRVRVHRLIAEPLRELWEAWVSQGLIGEILSWDGAFVERLVRGRKSLSSHAFGIAFDINAAWNRLGQPPAEAGTKGSVLRLVPLAIEHGFFWGGHFRTRPDGMHFEYAQRK